MVRSLLERKAIQKAWRQANRQRLVAYNKEWLFRHPEKAKMYRVRNGRRHELWSKYKLTTDQYSRMLERQAGLCAVCGQVRKLLVDHDHVTGRVRGLLCRRCNTGIGLLGDTRLGVQKAVAYLEKAQ